MRQPFIRDTVKLVDATAAGRRLHTWNDLLSSVPNVIGVKTGHTNGAGWSQVAAARGGGVTIYVTLLGGETRSERNADLAELLAWGLSRYRTVWAIDGARTYATARAAYEQPRVRLVAAKPALRVVHVERPLVERVVAPVEVELPVRRGQRLGEVQVLDRGTVIARSPLVAATQSSGRDAVGPHRVLRGPHAPPSRRPLLVIVTVTLNAALDRTLTVPHFQRGQRHRASQVLTLAGGKGINIARALKRLELPVVATGLAGGRTGTRIVEELTAEAILNDFVRIGEESRTSTAVVDPTEGSYTEINEWGPKVTPRSSRCCSRRCTISRVAPTSSSSPARCRAGRRELLRRGRSATSTAAVSRSFSTPRANRCGSASRRSRTSSRPTSARPSTSSARSSRTRRTS